MTIYQAPKRVWVITSKYAYMQAIEKMAGNGYYWYSQGEFPLEKALTVYESLIRKYPLFDDKNKVFQARKRGEPVGRLLLYKISEKTVHFTMMFDATEDQALAIYKSNGKELPKDLQNKFNRLGFTSYELVKHVRNSRDLEGKSKPNQNASWTWQYKKGDLESLTFRLLDAIERRQNQETFKILDTLSYSPGYAGVRKQVLELYSKAKAKWIFKNGQNNVLKTKPVLYIRKIEQRGVFLTPKLISQELERLELQKQLSLSRESLSYSQEQVDEVVSRLEGLSRKSMESPSKYD